MLKKGLIIAVITLVLDQANKWYMIEIMKISDPVEMTPFFNLVMVWNSGISFGMFQNAMYGQIIFSVIALLIVFILLMWLKKTSSVIESFSIGLVIGGAVGNVIDRLRYGAVADFYDFHLINYHWPAFNIADIAVFIGAIMLCVCNIFCKKEETGS